MSPTRLIVVLVVTLQAAAAPTPQAVSASIDQLVSFDYRERSAAARSIRRLPSADVVPALVSAARSHKDGYVRYRALVLLAGFGDAAAAPVMRSLIADPNDRVRAVAYAWFERAPDASVVPQLIEALDKEQSEFVRPALTRALAAAHAVPEARAAIAPAILQGEDFFRGSVIEALGDFGAVWAVPDIERVARVEGPLQDDAVTALGKLGQRSSLALLAELQKSAPRDNQPALSAATCLITKACGPQEDYLARTLRFAAADTQFQPLLRGAAFALAALGARGSVVATTALLDVAAPATDPARAALALAVGHVALRHPATMLETLEARADRAAAIEVLRDAFDMLNEDFEEERFFVEIRRAYWAAAEGSARRAVAQLLIDSLEF